ncbi:hypothetical protein ACJX0J_041235, partial [Zea mays]
AHLPKHGDVQGSTPTVPYYLPEHMENDSFWQGRSGSGGGEGAASATPGGEKHLYTPAGKSRLARLYYIVKGLIIYKRAFRLAAAYKLFIIYYMTNPIFVIVTPCLIYFV